MLTVDTEFKPAGQFARGAAINAMYRDRENRMTYTPREQARAETARDLVGIAFPDSECFINYRKKFIAVKISKPSRARMADRLAQMFEDAMEDFKATKVITDTSIVYRIPKSL
jgi:hypothetical protein